MLPNEIRAAIHDMLSFCAFGNDDAEFRRKLDAVSDWLHTLPEAPRPDWSQAPGWANWWAVDPDGYCHWFDNRPLLTTVTSTPDTIGPRWSHHGRKAVRYDAVEIPVGIDWRTLCEERPKEEA